MMTDEDSQPTKGRNYKVRQVTDYQVSWMQEERGEEGTFTVQLILDKGVEEHIMEVDADDLDIMLVLFKRSPHVMFDIERSLLIFDNLKPH